MIITELIDIEPVKNNTRDRGGSQRPDRYAMMKSKGENIETIA